MFKDKYCKHTAPFQVKYIFNNVTETKDETITERRKDSDSYPQKN